MELRVFTYTMQPSSTLTVLVAVNPEFNVSLAIMENCNFITEYTQSRAL